MSEPDTDNPRRVTSTSAWVYSPGRRDNKPLFQILNTAFGKEVPENVRGRRVRCPFCDSKIFQKKKPEVSRFVKAR